MKKYLLLFVAFAFIGIASAQETPAASPKQKTKGAIHSLTKKHKAVNTKSKSGNGKNGASQNAGSKQNEASPMESSRNGSGSTGATSTIDTHNGNGSTVKKVGK